MNKTAPPCPLPHPVACIYRLASTLIGLLQRWLTPLFDLALRLYVGDVFFRAGVLKVSDWAGTLSLFDYVYQVPLLPPHLAAVMGAAGELCLPVLLVLGVAGRFAAAGLFVTNLMAAISFPDISDLGLQDHWLWGSLLLVTVFHGPGRWSLDAWFKKRWGREG
ncbi:MAG: DoxX family protein [Rhodocyclaceae bacterium]|nr:MAG: DoxX family protein [Rhodocyclaceae bacterium]